MQFKEFLKQSAEEINLELETFLNNWYKEVDHLSPRVLPHAQALGSATSDGKRIRGALVMLGYMLYSKNPNQELLKIAVAYELFQTAILVHDDIIDNSPTRRGKPSLHMALGGNHYGMSQAICLGDIGFFLAYKLISESTFKDTLKTKATVYFTDSIIKTAIGEMLDVELSFKQTENTKEDLLAVSLLKTAYYTFVAPLTLGAILAGADEHVLEKIKLYGENIGIAFQLHDDINDVFATEQTLKKQIGGDIFEGKQTMLLLKAKEKADKKQMEILDTYYGNAAISQKEIEEVKYVFKETGALEYTQDLITDYSTKARKIIADITTDEHMEKMLGEIIDFVVRKENA